MFSLKPAVRTLNDLLIRPGETFSFWWLVRHAGKDTPYKDDLTVTNGKLTTMSGGGICQISNLLFRMLLHTPLTIIQRRGHKIEESPEPSSDETKGADATISEDWIDLKVRNDIDCTYQIWMILDDEKIIGQVSTDKEPQALYKITNGSIQYVHESGGIHEYAQVKRM